jgi:hypothetical protein
LDSLTRSTFKSIEVKKAVIDWQNIASPTQPTPDYGTIQG